MLNRSLTAVLLLCTAAACTPTATTTPATPVAGGPGVQDCRLGMADVSGEPASAMTVTPSGAASDGVTKMVVTSPNGRRALCQIGAGGTLVKFDMM